MITKITRAIMKRIYAYDPLNALRNTQLREQGRLLDIQQLKKHFKGKSICAFGTGGSVANLNLKNMSKYNTLTVTMGPYYFQKKYKCVPNIWIVHNPDSIEMLLKELKKNPKEKLNLDDTFIFIPGNDSDSKITFDSYWARQLRKQFPHATYVTYREKKALVTPEKASTYLSGKQPFTRINGSTLENIMLPIIQLLGIKEVYFSGVDHMDTGHFWDRKRTYQNKEGVALKFAEDKTVLKAARAAKKIAHKKGMQIFRLEKKETLLTLYPHCSLAKATKTKRITPQSVHT